MILSIDVSKKISKLEHFWEKIIGSGYLSLLQRRDLSEYFKLAHDELGFQYFRCHGIFSDDLKLVLSCTNDLITENDLEFFNIDLIFDFMLKIGFKPFVEFSFMPNKLASSDKTLFTNGPNITPPKSYNLWNSLLDHLIKHWIDRYGPEEVRSWYFEIWNEPNIKSFWTGSKEDYFKLYMNSAKIIKEIDPKLRIGGPATATGKWIKEFTEFCDQHQIPFDFLSTHIYPSEASTLIKKDETQEILRKGDINDILEKNKKFIEENKFKGTEIYITQYNSSSTLFDTNHDLPNQAAFICHYINKVRGLVNTISYWTISDIFEQKKMPNSCFHGGSGLMTINGIRKPSWNVYKLLHMLGTEELEINTTEFKYGQGILSTINNDGNEISILIWNYLHPDDESEKEQHNMDLTIKILKIPPRFERSVMEIYRIDEEHCNPQKLWVQMGSPKSPTPDQLQDLNQIAAIHPDVLHLRFGDHSEIDPTLASEGVCLIKIKAKK